MEDFKQTCWKLFSQTGDIKYDRLYHAINETEMEDERS